MTKPKSPNEVALETLQTELEKRRKEVAAAELLISELKRQNKPAFIERKPVRAWMKVVRAVTSPFARLYQDNDYAIEYPTRYQREKLMSKAEKELKRCKEVENREHRHAKTTAVRSASLVIMLEEESARSEWPAAQTMCTSLRQEIERLRPMKSEQQKQEEKEEKDKMTKIIDQVLIPATAKPAN